LEFVIRNRLFHSLSADAEAAVARLDALEADPARRTAAVGSIPP
jgi:hypothetical protein